MTYDLIPGNEYMITISDCCVNCKLGPATFIRAEEDASIGRELYFDIGMIDGYEGNSVKIEAYHETTETNRT